jgi:hypothetical protein
MKGLLTAFDAAINLMEFKKFKMVFGENAYSQINNIYYSGQKKSFVVDVTLYTDEPQLLEDSYNTVYEDFIRNSWKLLGFTEKLIIIKSCELLTS